MEPISVVIITLNEEKNIGRCLDSVIEIADEIIVVDSFSSDDTQNICNKRGVRFIQTEWQGYVDTKNLAVQYATHDLILSLDADEALSEELKISVKKLKTARDKNGYYVKRLTNYCGQWIHHCGWYPDAKLRLWDRTKGSWTGVDIHEGVTLNNGEKSGTLDGDLLHYSYYTIDEHIRQAVKFSSISAESFYKQGKKSGIIHIFISPYVRFIRDYFFKLGFLDGYYGFVICMISAHATFLKYVFLKEKYKVKR
jgi:glycosyltransferase involved in cell wall biosynthesis